MAPTNMLTHSSSESTCGRTNVLRRTMYATKFIDKRRTQELDILISKFYIHLDVKIVLSNKFTIGSFFKFKDNLPKNMCSSLVYKFSCAHGTSEYVGFTTRDLRTRVSEHVGRSHRTGAPLSKPPHSAIRNHSDQCVCEMLLDNLKSLVTPVNLQNLEF